MNLTDIIEMLVVAIQVKQSLKAYVECKAYDVHIIRQAHRNAMRARREYKRRIA